MSSFSVSYAPVYDRCFPAAADAALLPQDTPPNFQTLSQALTSPQRDRIGPLSQRPVDFSMQEKGWVVQAKRISAFLTKFVLFPAACLVISQYSLTLACLPIAHELLRYAVQRFAMMLIYPAQSRLTDRREGITLQNRDQAMSIALDNIIGQGGIARPVSLEKNGTRYSGLLVGFPETIQNGKWALQAVGNRAHIEESSVTMISAYRLAGWNTLFINGPAVGRSEGQATPSSMGDAQEVGICFLETAIKARNIVLAGHSLGGAALGQAILKHSFKRGITYSAVIMQMTFSSASRVAGKFVERRLKKIQWMGIDRLVQALVCWSGCEMNIVAATKKLQQLNIRQIIVQPVKRDLGGAPIVKESFKNDGPIAATATLGYELFNQRLEADKAFCYLVDAPHWDPKAISRPLEILEEQRII